jgi:hypothetical protein
MKKVRYTILLLALALLSAGISAQDIAIDEDDVRIGAREYSPYLNQGFQQRVYWGDTHVHTSYSTDAGMIGNRLGPDEAYQFALGKTVVSSTGLPVRLQRPLDFIVIADHAENLGLAPMIAEANPELLATEFGRKVYDQVQVGDVFGAYLSWGTEMIKGVDPLANDALTQSIWERITAAAEKYNNPGQFTALIGFEWSSVPDGNNLHRNVIFRGGKDKADRIIPYSNYDSTDPEDLWKWMNEYEQKTGGKLLAIPHNGNLSNGLMFDDKTLSGKRLTESYAKERMRWEPIYEVTQIKGDGETHAILSPTDEFADYGTWDKGSFGAEPKTEDMLPREYFRTALQRGLKYAEKLGTNPFKFGAVGSSDAHTSLATTQEDNFFGKAAPMEPGQPGRFDDVITGMMQVPDGPDITIYHVQALSSGLAGVWATENTRTGLFDAMQRKEVYATTGTRMTVRLFAGWEFTESDVHRPDFAEHGYRHGVPMGGDLRSAPDGQAPTFVVRAVRDPDWANLDRIQIVKGWLDSDGELQERIYDISVSGNREIDAEGRCKTRVGNTVDVDNATFTNAVGEPLLMAYWKDPDFDAAERAVYYVRVLEIPTPNWTTFDAAYYGVERPDNIAPTQQERAYTSPIWYTP